MKKAVVSLAALVLIGVTAAAAQELKTDQDKEFYALGQIMGQRIIRGVKGFVMTPAERTIFMAGLHDAVTETKSKVDMSVYEAKVMELYNSRAEARTAAEKAEAEAAKAKADAEKAKAKPFMDKMAKEAGAVKTDSGMIYIPQKAGSGPSPKPSDTVKVNYKGTLIDGTEFDSSYKRNQPAEFSLGGVIPCWTEGLQKMKAGGKAKLICPSSIAYGDQGNAKIPGGSTLVFEVELLEIKAPAAAKDAEKPKTTP